MITNNSGGTSNPYIPRPRFAYFDREGTFTNAYIGTQGRGVWRVTLPRARPWRLPFRRELVCAGDCAPLLVDPYTGSPTTARRFLDPDHCTVCQFIVASGGDIRGLRLEGQTVKGVTLSGGRLLGFNARGAEVSGNIPPSLTRGPEEFGACLACRSVREQAGAIRGLVLERGRLRALLVEYEMSRR